MSASPLHTFTKRLGIAAVAIVAVHIAIALYAAGASTDRVASSSILTWYRHLVVLGPFFHESRITDSPHLYVRYKQGSQWSASFDNGGTAFQQYSGQPWRYAKLRAGDYERYLIRDLSAYRDKPWQTVKDTKAFRALNQFVLHEIINTPADSVAVMYVSRIYLPATNTYRADTIFNYSYSPADIAASKK